MENKTLELTQRINQAAEAINTKPPKEIIDIFQNGIVASQAGTKNQYFSTLVFIQGVCRSLAYDCVNNLVYMMDDPNFTKKHIEKMVRQYFRSNANFLGYCGLKDVWIFAKSIINLLEETNDKGDIEKMVHAYNYYLANLYTWIQHYFPWNLGKQFPLNLPTETSKVTNVQY